MEEKDTETTASKFETKPSPEQERAFRTEVDRKRWSEIDRVLTHAMRGKQDQEIDPMFRQTIVGFVEPLADGGYQFLPEYVQKQSNVLKVQALDLDGKRRASIEKLSKNGAQEIASLNNYARIIRDAIDTEEKNGETSLQNDANIQKFLTAIDGLDETKYLLRLDQVLSLARFVIDGEQGRLTNGALKSKIAAMKEVTDDEKEKILDTEDGGKKILDDADAHLSAKQADTIIDALVTLARPRLLDNKGSELPLTEMVRALDSKVRGLSLALKAEAQGQTKPRREFFNRIVGTDAETILRFAAEGDYTKGYTVDFSLLADQLKALGIETDSAALLTQCNDRFAFNPRKNFRDTFSGAEFQKLREYLRTLVPEAGGMSLQRMTARVGESVVLSEAFKRLIHGNTQNGVLKIASLKFAYQSRCPQTQGSVLFQRVREINPIKIKEHANLLPGDKVPANWDPAPLIHYLVDHYVENLIDEQKLSQALTYYFVEKPVHQFNIRTFVHDLTDQTKWNLSGDKREVLDAIGSTVEDKDVIPADDETMQRLVFFLRSKIVEKMTGVAPVALTTRDRFRAWTDESKRQGGVVTEAWLEWMKSLRHPLWPVDEKVDENLEKLLERLDAVQSTRDAVSECLPDEKGSMLEEGDRLLRSIIDDERALGRTVEEMQAPRSVARTMQQKIEQAKELLDVALFVFHELQLDPSFASLRTPAERRRAFLIAMHGGIDAAREYLRHPNTWESNSGDLSPSQTDVRDAEKRIWQASEARGNPLAALRRMGVEVDPSAVGILAQTLDPKTGVPLTIASHPRQALEIILRGPASTKKAVIDAYVLRTDQKNPPVAVDDAVKAVSDLAQYLEFQKTDLSLTQEQVKGNTGKLTVIDTFNAAVGAVKEMVNGDTFAEKALGIGIIGGGLYAIIKSWPDHWKKYVGGLALVAGDVAMQRMSGQGLLDRMNIGWTNARHRNSSRERFITRAGRHPSFAALDTPAGREAIDQLIGKRGNAPSVGALLSWRARAKAGTTAGAGAENVGLRPLAIAGLLGTQTLSRMNAATQKEKGYEIALTAFNAFCVDVAKARGLGGLSVEDQAEAGANWLRMEYTNLDEDFVTTTDRVPGLNQHGQMTEVNPPFHKVMTYERPSEDLVDAMATTTWPEYLASVTGVPMRTMRDYLRMGYTAVEAQAMIAQEKIPEWYEWSKDSVLFKIETFAKWYKPRVRWHRSKEEFMETMHADFEAIKGICYRAGLVIKEDGPDAVRWMVDAGVRAAEFTAETAVSVYHDLHAHHISGPVLNAFEDFVERQFHRSIEEMELERYADVEAFKGRMVDLLSAKLSIAGGPRSALNAWSIGIGLESFDATTKVVTVAEKDPVKRALMMDMLERSIFSYLIAVRCHAIRIGGANPKIGLQMPVQLPQAIDKDTYRFTIADQNVRAIYNHVFSDYSPRHVLRLLGQEVALGQKLEDWSNAGGVQGALATATNFVAGPLLFARSSDYIAHALSVALEPLVRDAKEHLTEDETKAYMSYLQTLQTNVVIEMTLDPTLSATTDPLHLTVEQAKDYLTQMLIRRGKAPRRVLAEDYTKLKDAYGIFTKADIPTPTPAINQLLNNPQNARFLGGQAKAPPAAPQGTPQAPGVSPTTTQSTPAAAPSPAKTIEKHDLNQDIDRAALLAALPTASSADQDRIRELFDNYVHAGSISKTAKSDAKRALLLDLVKGTSDSWGSIGLSYWDKAHKAYVADFSSVDDLQFAVHALALTQPGDIYHDRLKTLSTAVLGQALQKTYDKFASDSVSATAEAIACAKEAEKIGTPGAKNAASLLVEYCFCGGGKYATKAYADYEAYLQAVGLQPPPEAQKRFAAKAALQGATVRGMLSSLAQ